MDRESPDHYCERSAEASVAATSGTIKHIRGLNSLTPGMTLVHPILTPRFAISCTPELLTSLGKVANDDPSLAIQTHISENPSEIAFVRQLFPECRTYAQVYEQFGLLRSNTVLAHGCHLDSHLVDAGADEQAIPDSEIELIKRRGAGLSHCPTSNLNLRSGVARVGEWLDRGLKVRFSPIDNQLLKASLRTGFIGHRRFRGVLSVHVGCRPPRQFLLQARGDGARE